MVKEHNNNIAKYLLAADVHGNCLNHLNDETDREVLAEILGNLITEQISMLSVRENIFEVAFLPKGKEPKYVGNGIWSRENRQIGKPTKTVKKLIRSKNFTDEDYERFNNLLRGCIENNHRFELVKGKEIPHFYDYQNYYQLTATLGDSCMRDVDSEFFDIYQDHAEMLVLLKNEKLMGRALVGTIDNQKYMDRVYFISDHLYQKFIDYAIDNKGAFRKSNSMLNDGDMVSGLVPEDNYQSEQTLDLSITLCNRYTYFPYMDSFRYLYNGYISTDPDHSGNYQTLSFTDGELGDEYTCAVCGETFRFNDFDDQDEMIFSNGLDSYLCKSCYVGSERLDDALPTGQSVRAYWDKRDYDWMPNGDDDIVEINGQWWFKEADCVEYNEKTDTYKINE